MNSAYCSLEKLEGALDIAERAERVGSPDGDDEGLLVALTQVCGHLLHLFHLINLCRVDVHCCAEKLVHHKISRLVIEWNATLDVAIQN